MSETLVTDVARSGGSVGDCIFGMIVPAAFVEYI